MLNPFTKTDAFVDKASKKIGAVNTGVNDIANAGVGAAGNLAYTGIYGAADGITGLAGSVGGPKTQNLIGGVVDGATNSLLDTVDEYGDLAYGEVDKLGGGVGGLIPDNDIIKIPNSGNIGKPVEQEEDPFSDSGSGGNDGGRAGTVSSTGISDDQENFSENPSFGRDIKLNLESTQKTIPTMKDLSSPTIIGLPPHAYLDVGDGGNSSNRLDKLVIASMPLLELEPCLPKFGGAGDNGAGLQLFHLDEAKGMESWKKIVTHCGFKNVAEAQGDSPIKIAFLNETSLGEQWSSQFADTSFEDMMNQGSSMAQSVRMITGTDNMGDAAKQLGGAFGGSGQEIGNQIGGMIGGVEGGIDKLFGSSGTAARKLFTGSRVDFPQIWKSSSFEPSYNLTIRLYNPWPNNTEAYNRFILAPLCMILALTVPMSDSKWTYNYPLFCKARCSGLFDLPSAALSSVRVIKGGDTNDVSWHQQPGTVDLQITLDSLFQTMVATTDDSNEVDSHTERPTLKRYFDSLRDFVDYKTPFENPPNISPIIKDAGGLDLDAIHFPTNPQTDQILTDIPSRVPSITTDITDALGADFDAGLFDTLASKAEVMSGVTDQLDTVKNATNNGIGNVTDLINESLGNFDIGGLGLLNPVGIIPEYSKAGFSGAATLEKSLQDGATENIGGPGFPGGISASEDAVVNGSKLT